MYVCIVNIYSSKCDQFFNLIYITLSRCKFAFISLTKIIYLLEDILTLNTIK